MNFEWTDFVEGGVGAIIGSVLTILGFRSRLDKSEIKQAGIEKDCTELKTEMLAMFSEIRKDIKKLIEKTAQGRDG